MKKALFAAGCFWGVEEAFRTHEGVVSTRVGYTGGHTENPTYEDVCGGATGHAETVEVMFDESVVGYEELVRFFFKLHDPTQINRQGPDVGSQYRSAVFYFDDEQKGIVERVKIELEESGEYAERIATEIIPAETFYEAEDYHQQYFQKRGGGTCHV